MISTRIDWVRDHCHLLRAISEEFRRTRPFQGLTIGTGIHLEAKTVALILTLRDGGARLVATGNLNTTQPDAVEALRAEDITVIGGPTKDRELHGSYLDQVLAAQPDLILDNGGDLFTRYPDRPYPGLIGGTEETTSGRMRLEPLRGRLRRPILVINDSPIKQFAENDHAVGQSSLESFLRLTTANPPNPGDNARGTVREPGHRSGGSSPGSRSLPFFDRSGSVHAERLKQQGRLFPLFIFEMLTSTRRLRVSGLLVALTQRTHSQRAIGVISFHRF
jgi:S-adenosyl-L-homocysteine hydrolase